MGGRKGECAQLAGRVRLFGQVKGDAGHHILCTCGSTDISAALIEAVADLGRWTLMRGGVAGGGKGVCIPAADCQADGSRTSPTMAHLVIQAVLDLVVHHH